MFVYSMYFFAKAECCGVWCDCIVYLFI